MKSLMNIEFIPEILNLVKRHQDISILELQEKSKHIKTYVYMHKMINLLDRDGLVTTKIIGVKRTICITDLGERGLKALNKVFRLYHFDLNKGDDKK